MKVKLKPITAFELIDHDGKVVATLTAQGDWQGMSALTDVLMGATLVIETPSPLSVTLAESRAAIVGDGFIECDVVKISPALAAQLHVAIGAEQ